MSDITNYIRLPSALSDKRLMTVPSSIDDDEFAAHQIEFVRHVFSYCAHLHEHARETPVSDAFLAVFVNLFEVMDTNAPDDARRCALQLREVFRVIFPELEVHG
ncbi:hypothetical protein [Paraburkholderia megapolitana]|uniref:Uncharacterized protein n=1 Tax=Paraburkholderia megapolitana TaxID=420953 RepID=A0A1I3Q4N3_9BURK|nr:hypothetical protein [Paraburkholderia megapolitana]QDQ81111.1 hypothetical protein FNZ07_07960 [Paraburkholderia megapolitana]SFJ28828.1 hypothetical protein SAMN05192543_106211 [Paraburkholderia megapolitana]